MFNKKIIIFYKYNLQVIIHKGKQLHSTLYMVTL